MIRSLTNQEVLPVAVGGKLTVESIWDDLDLTKEFRRCAPTKQYQQQTYSLKLFGNKEAKVTAADTTFGRNS